MLVKLFLAVVVLVKWVLVEQVLVKCILAVVASILVVLEGHIDQKRDANSSLCWGLRPRFRCCLIRFFYSDRVTY